jgi:photosystem II stability/assembly factor-like uncharacterized protein
MKYAHIVGVLSILLSFAQNTLAYEWDWLYPEPSGAALRSVVLTADGEQGWIVGDRGTVLQLTNGEWSRDSINTHLDLRGIAVADDGDKIVVGDSGSVFLSSGTHWVEGRTGTRILLNDVTMADANRGWAAGHGAILGTQDGGRTWRPEYTMIGLELSAIACFDDQSALAVGWLSGEAHGDGVILETNDGGASWREQKYGPKYRMDDVWADKGGKRAWICGTSTGARSKPPLVIHTSDRGTHWRQHPSEANGALYSIMVVDSTVVGVGMAESGNAWVSISTDEGATWQNTYLPAHLPLYSAAGSDPSQMISVGGSGFIVGPSNLTERGGNVPIVDRILAINFVNADRGVFVGEDGLIRYTEDAGATWLKPRRIMPATYTDVAWTSRDVAYAVGEGGLLIRTLDAGKTWKMRPMDDEQNDMECIEAYKNELWAATLSSGIIVSRDRGNSWNRVQKPTDESLVDMDISPDGTITILTRDGKIWRTDSQDIDWESMRVSKDIVPTALETPGTNEIFVSAVVEDGESVVGNVFVSSNGGEDWEVQQFPIPVSDIAFESITHGVAVGIGTVYTTEDGGLSWTVVAEVPDAVFRTADASFGVYRIGGDDNVMIGVER